MESSARIDCKTFAEKSAAVRGSCSFNGASILGLQGIIIKSHGNAGVSGFTTAIQQADREITANVHERISAHVANYKRDL
jgi:fatty acid/phospholipid biosynthesis enzyme